MGQARQGRALPSQPTQTTPVFEPDAPGTDGVFSSLHPIPEILYIMGDHVGGIMRRIPRYIGDWVDRRSSAAVSLLVPLLISATAILDYASPLEMACGVFYLLPVWLTAWKWGRTAGIGVAGCCAIVWTTMDYAGHDGLSPFTETWNGAIQFGIFSIVAWTVASLKLRLESLNVVNIELRVALEEVQRLSGLLPICAWCKKIRDNAGKWVGVEEYLSAHADVDFTHSICPDCAERHRQELSRIRKAAGSRP